MCFLKMRNTNIKNANIYCVTSSIKLLVFVGKPSCSDSDETSTNSSGRQGCAVAATVIVFFLNIYFIIIHN